MEPHQVIAELIQRQGGLAALDRLHLPYARANAGPAAKFGLAVELFLPDIDRAVLRERAAQFLSDYWQTFPERVNALLLRDKRRAVKFSGDPSAQLRADLDKYPIDSGYSGALFGAVDIGLPNDDIPPYQASVLISRREEHELSFVCATFPICQDDIPRFELLLTLVLRWCELCQPVHGSAGYALLFAPGMQQNTAQALSLIKRFPGLDILNSPRFSLETGAVHDRIKSVNWLTVLNDDLVQQSGGLDAMRAALEPFCKVRTYSGGVVIQAGIDPQLGDLQTGNIAEAYRQVARHLQPLRFENYRDGLFRVPSGLDAITETLSWLRRFD
ncbi:type VI immunity family protein [Chitinimonas lacunae]|uniref:Type VI immunity family protein n=1 Tax=Chitinimonas lacunae TaxID=1963018 RepID=A0ABV8MPJ8_9NEIS